jgi:hypothetical protein
LPSNTVGASGAWLTRSATTGKSASSFRKRLPYG